LHGLHAQTGALLILGRQVCGSWDTAIGYEWLVTNGLGGYACGTVAGANTRRYHGFLMASFAPPVARTLLVSKIDVRATYLGRCADLSANEFGDGTVSPRGFEHLESFALQDGIPTWEFALGDALLQQKIYMPPGANCSYLRLKLLRASASMQLNLRPFTTYRDYHSQARGTQAMSLDADDHSCRIQAANGAKPYRLSLSGGAFAAAPNWYWNFKHRMEVERGLDSLEDLFNPGEFTCELTVGMAKYFVANADAAEPRDGEQVLQALRDQAKALTAPVPLSTPPAIRSLALAANQFVVHRQAQNAGEAGTTSIIAGYPWFADWGRDTMISLPGLTTALKRYDITADVLRTYARYIDRGMLPNRFPDDGESPEYNTADATLWMFHALDDYLRARPDPSLAREMFPLLMAILHAHCEGTRYGIGVDPADGLLRAGERDTQLTWMDARHGDRTFTPRVGKPVEINALWINALDVGLKLAGRFKAGNEKAFCQDYLTRATGSFGRFWNASQGCLFDVLDMDGGVAPDARIRPNQILAVSLPLCALSAGQMRGVVDVCARELLTSYGLRSLSPQDVGYIGRYNGDPQQRDGAYHMGTAWSWLLGPFARAHYRVHGDARVALSFLAPIQQHLQEACIGNISEIFDGDAPHSARGCFAQAWSIAEILRAWLYLERRMLSP
jgi:predicted glycogen debranching enzyme